MTKYFLRLLRLIGMLMLAVTVAWLIGGSTVDAYTSSRLMPREQTLRLGLKRAWYAQVQLDRARNQVERAVIAGDHLIVLTTSGVVQNFDALTGATHWVAPFGNPLYPSLGPAVNDKFVALVNGSTLYVLDLKDGRPTKIRRVGGAPGASPALSNKYVFVPLTNGRVEGYPLDGKVRTPWFYQSYGRAMVAPLVTPTSLVWSTDSGHVYGSDANEPGTRFRLETGSPIVASPSFKKPFIYVGTVAGEVFALDESTGVREWKFATGYPVTRSPAAIGDRVYVTSEKPSLTCLDAKNGQALWEAADITQFAAASKQRVYAVDQLGALVVLDAATGAVLGAMPNDEKTTALVNDQTDRIYLVSADGMVQCFHEIGADQVTYHNPPEPPTPAEGAEKPRTRPSSAPASSDETQPTQPAEKPEAADAKKPLEPAADAADKSVEPAKPPAAGATEANPFDF